MVTNLFEMANSQMQAVGVKVATPRLLCIDDTIIGTPFFIMDYCSGQGQARRITRDPTLADFGDRLAGELGREMARIHAVTTSAAELSFLVWSVRGGLEAMCSVNLLLPLSLSLRL